MHPGLVQVKLKKIWVLGLQVLNPNHIQIKKKSRNLILQKSNTNQILKNQIQILILKISMFQSNKPFTNTNI